MSLGKTPWVDKNVVMALPSLRRVVPESWLPRMITEYNEEVRRGPDWDTKYETVKLKKPVVEEYGCGSYGCVMPTSEPGLVMKLTSDVSEAWFIARAREIDYIGGIVEYKKIFALPTKHKGRPLFVLWRTEARYIGDWSYTTHHHDDRTAAGSYQPSAYSRRVAAEANTQLNAFMRWAWIARAYIHPMLRAAEKQTSAHAVLERREEFRRGCGESTSPPSVQRTCRLACSTGIQGVLLNDSEASRKSAWHCRRASTSQMRCRATQAS